MDKAKTNRTNNSTQLSFPPVVAVLGHVDHGKTTLLDAIRQTSVADREKGGITQTIGASSIEFSHEGQNRRITFVDTPGHEAFTKMRGRGAQAADIGILVVAATDGVKPQTRESIEALKTTQTPFIVAITKSDLPTKNPEKAKQELLKEEVQLEGYGGDIPVLEVSAKTNQNIKELLDMILLMFAMHKSPDYDKEVSESAPLKAIVIEAKLDTKAGPKATVVIKNGKLNVRDDLQIDGQFFKVRMLINDKGVQLKSATVGDAVEILGFEKVPNVGSIISHKSQILPAFQPDNSLLKPLMKELIYQKEEKKTGISVVLISDTQGSLEAIMNAFPKGVAIILKKTGEVSDADILLAKSTGSIVLSFNTKIKPDVAKLAFTEKVLLRNYEIIYELLDEVEDALEGQLLSQMEQTFGRAKVLAKFPYEKTFAFGIMVNEGRVARGDHIRVLREDVILGETLIHSLRVGKNPTSKVEKGHEAGITISTPLDIKVGDVILSHS